MKKLVLFSVAFCAFAIAQGQLNLSLGPNAGFGHTWLKGGSGDNKYKPSGNFGLALVYSANEHIGIGADLKYSIEGGKREVSSSNTSTTRLNYIRIPVKGIYFFGNHGEKLRPKVSIGPSFGFLVGGKQEVNEVETGLDVKDFYKSFDVGLIANAGLHYRLVQNTWLAVDVEYYHGFMDILENSSQNLKNRNLGLNVGVLFGIGTHGDGK